jgi:hypothetical protein
VKIIVIIAAASFTLALAFTTIAEEAAPAKSLHITAAQKSKIENDLINASKVINRGLPIMIDAQTRADTTLAVGMQFIYKYTLLNIASENFDTKKFRDALEPALLKANRADEAAVPLFKQGVDYVYIYFDKNGVLITSVTINKRNLWP